MIINKLYLTTLYFLSILFFFNYTSPFIFWVMTEINLILFVLVMLSFMEIKFSQEMNDLILFYFVIQSLASIFLLSDFFFSEFFFMFNSDFMFIVSLLIKLGIFPFFYWVFKISDYLSFFPLVFLLTFQKIPFFSIFFFSNNVFISNILMFSFITGTFLILFSSNFIYMLVSSSISSSFWIFYLNLMSLYFFLFYFFVYSIFIFFMLKLFFALNKKGANFFFMLMLFSFLIGLPPMSLFFFKLILVHFFLFNFSDMELIIFFLLSFIGLFGYMKYSFKSFFMNTELYVSISNSKNLMSFFYFTILFFFLLFI